MDYKKPQDTLVHGGIGLYPLTTADQVILSDGSRLEKDGKINADKLDGRTLAEIMLALYPVGAIYTSTVATSPASLFGGTWEILNDVFLLAAGSYANAGTFGGEATHTLTVNELPAHTHTATVYGIGSGNYTANAAKLVYKDNTTTAWISEGLSWVDSTGGSQSHNNLPPYLAVYMWKRVS